MTEQGTIMGVGQGADEATAATEPVRRPDSLPTKDLSRLDEKGRCCGRKPIFYKGGSWRSPIGAPLYWCCECGREFDPDGKQRANWDWRAVEPGKFERRKSGVA